MTTIELPQLADPTPSPTPPRPPSQGWTPPRTVAVVFGSILATAGVLVLIAGLVVLGVSGRRDRAGYFHTHTEPITSQQFAVTSDPLDLGSDARPGNWGWKVGDFVKLRLRAQTFWTASSTGTGQQSLEWTPSNGEWTLVVMNADGHKNVATDLDVGVNVEHLGLIIGSLLVTGVLIGAGGVVLIVVPIRRSRRPQVITTF